MNKGRSNEMKWLVYMVMAICVLVVSPGCRKDGNRSDKDDRQSEGDGKQAKEADEQFGRYEATSEFTMDMRRLQANDDPAELMERTFNVRKPGWRSDEIFTKVIQVYRGWRPTSQVTDKELSMTLATSKLELVSRSRLVRITVRSDSPELAADLANAYVEAIEKFTDEENKKRCDRAVAEIHQQVEKQKRADDELAMKLLAFQAKNKIDVNGPKDMRVEASLKQLKQEKEISSAMYQSLLQKERLHRIAAEQNNEIIRVGRPAQVPTKPVGR